MAANRAYTAVVFGDSHFPFHDPKAIKGALNLVKEVEPDGVVHLGDIVDCWQISDFDKDIERLDTLQSNIHEATDFLASLRRVAPKAEITLLEGNHEDRLRRAIWRAGRVLREILRLDQVGLIGKEGGWKKILRLNDMGIRWVGLNDQSHANVLPKIITKHGTKISTWAGVTARNEWMKYGRSGISGHTHRLSYFGHRDHNGRSVWIEAGCTCDLNPVYCDDPDWQQGAVILRWSNNRRVMGEQIVGFRDGEYVI
ncbi:MAG: hypothetical protein A2Y38_16665 [Spirochaetes bacterium GWB1_59_5]|nr:MAG: hypothetical protein A2Y38_16665 [Spirochaetes bacterium GWB1_59_5]